MKSKQIVLAVALFCSTLALGQVPVTLEQAIDTALSNNLKVKNERLKATYQKQLIKSGASIPGTSITGGFGQMNSLYVDKSIGISQSLNFPTVYSKQVKLLTEEYKSSVLLVGIQEVQLKLQVTQLFNTILYLENKKQLLERNDSLFSSFLAYATMRFNKGESNLLEKTTAENQRGQIQLQLQQLAQDLELRKLEFQLLLNSTSQLIPVGNSEKKNQIAVLDTTILKNHPTMKYFEQQKQVALAQTQAERAKLLPDLLLSYQIMSMRGVGADNVAYNGALHFQSGQIGLGIPVFAGGQRAKINAARTNQLVAEGAYDYNLQAFEVQYYGVYSNYQKFAEAVNYFETVALSYAETIRSTANLQLKNGEINYLDWVQLIHQSTTIQSDYIEAINNRDNALAELNYFINK